MAGLRLIAAMALLLWTCACAASEPGTVTGHVIEDDGSRVELRHVAAIRLDGAEGIYEPAVRVLLSDRPVDPETIERLMFPEIFYLASRGEVRGLLLEFSPANPNRLRIDRLAPPDHPGTLIAGSLTLENHEASLWRRMSGDENQVSGEFAPRDGLDASFSFSTPVGYDPIARRMNSSEAGGSELAALYIRRTEALGRGDLAAAAELSTRSSAARIEPFPPEAMDAIRQMVAATVEAARNPQGAIIRSRSAVLMLGDDAIATFEREDGQWKVAD